MHGWFCVRAAAAACAVLLVALLTSHADAAVLTGDRPPIAVEPYPPQDDSASVWVVRVFGPAPSTAELDALAADGMRVLTSRTYTQPRGAGTLLRIQHTASSLNRGYAHTLSRLERAFNTRDAGIGRLTPTVIAEPEREVRARVIWSLDRIDQRTDTLDNSYSPAHSGAGVTIYIVDTGVTVSLSQFGGRASNGYTAFGTNFVDENGHGTHVAGTAASITYGVAKLANIVNVRVLGADGSGTTGTLSDGLAWVLANGERPAVVSMSLGMLGESAIVTSYCQSLIAAGFVVVAAAGNDDLPGCLHFPSAVPGVLSVLASDINDVGASFNNYGTCTDLFAPGVDVTSLKPDGGTRSLSGTSMATPHAAGACALLLQQMPSAHAPVIFQALFSQATNNTITSTHGSPNVFVYIVPSTGSSSSSSSGMDSSSALSSSSSSSSASSSSASSSTAATTSSSSGASVSAAPTLSMQLAVLLTVGAIEVVRTII